MCRKKTIQKLIDIIPLVGKIVLFLKRVNDLVYVFKVIEMLTQDFSKRGQALFFYNLKPSVVAVFEGVQPKDFITYYHRQDLDQLFKKWKSVFIKN